MKEGIQTLFKVAIAFSSVFIVTTVLLVALDLRSLLEVDAARQPPNFSASSEPPGQTSKRPTQFADQLIELYHNVSPLVKNPATSPKYSERPANAKKWTSPSLIAGCWHDPQVSSILSESIFSRASIREPSDIPSAGRTTPRFLASCCSGSMSSSCPDERRRVVLARIGDV